MHMTAFFQTSALERRIWASSFDDGIYDIFLGWLIFWMGFVFMLSSAETPDTLLLVINLTGIAATIQLMFYTKKRIAAPRTGSVIYSKQRKSRIGLMFAIGFVFLMSLFLFSLHAWQSAGEGHSTAHHPLTAPLLLGLLLFVLFGLHAFFLEFDRLYYIGCMFCLPFPAGRALELYLGIEPGIVLYIIFALAVILPGIRLLRRFLKSHPAVIPTEEGGKE